MEIKSIPEIIKEMDYLVKEEKFDEAYQFAKENVNLNKEYVEGEYIFKNLLEELLFQITIKKEIKRKYPLMLDYSTLYSNYGNVLLHFNEYENAQKWHREVYALFYFDEDVQADSLSFFFRNNGGPLPKEAVNGIESIGYDKIQSVVSQMYAMCDDKNENVSFDKNRITELDEKFRNLYNSDEFFEKIKLYILNAV